MKTSRAELELERDLFSRWLLGERGPLAAHLETHRRAAWQDHFRGMPEEAVEKGWFKFIHDRILLARPASITRRARELRPKDPVGWLFKIYVNATRDALRPIQGGPSTMGTDYLDDTSRPLPTKDGGLPVKGDPIREASDRELAGMLGAIRRELGPVERLIFAAVETRILSGRRSSLRAVWKELTEVIEDFGRTKFRGHLDRLRARLANLERSWFGEPARAERKRRSSYPALSLQTQGDSHEP